MKTTHFFVIVILLIVLSALGNYVLIKQNSTDLDSYKVSLENYHKELDNYKAFLDNYKTSVDSYFVELKELNKDFDQHVHSKTKHGVELHSEKSEHKSNHLWMRKK